MKSEINEMIGLSIFFQYIVQLVVVEIWYFVLFILFSKFKLFFVFDFWFFLYDFVWTVEDDEPQLVAGRKPAGTAKLFFSKLKSIRD